METKLQSVKDQILLALGHPEAEEGLYFRNLCIGHEADERPIVKAKQEEGHRTRRESGRDHRKRVDTALGVA